jgi:hypothetical protein
MLYLVLVGGLRLPVRYYLEVLLLTISDSNTKERNNIGVECNSRRFYVGVKCHGGTGINVICLQRRYLIMDIGADFNLLKNYPVPN